MNDLSIEGLVWLVIAATATLPAVIFFRIWLRYLMKLGRVGRSRSIMFDNLTEWKYLGLLFRRDPDATADLWRRRTVWALTELLPSYGPEAFLFSWGCFLLISDYD